MVYNALNFPAGVVRMTRVTEEDDGQMKDYPEHDMYHRKVKKVRLHSWLWGRIYNNGHHPYFWILADLPLVDLIYVDPLNDFVHKDLNITKSSSVVSSNVVVNLRLHRFCVPEMRRFRLHLHLSVISQMAIWSILEKDKYLQFLCVPLNYHLTYLYKSNQS